MREIYLPSGIVMVIVGRYGLLVLIFGGHDRGELLYPAGCLLSFLVPVMSGWDRSYDY